MKLHHTLLLGLAFLSFSASADAQLLGRWFGPKGDKGQAKATQPDPRRLAEVNVEIAWLADPITFPYYLEARVGPSQLEVRGFVPDKSVREHALRIAQMYSALPIVDALKEHPSLLVRPSPMSPQHLQTSVQSSLRMALPRQYQHLKTETGKDGKVFVVGSVNTLEEKLAVSHALRRLHGCTSVQNLTTMPGEQSVKTPIIPASNQKPVDDSKKPWRPFGKNPTTTEEPPLLDNQKPKGPELINKQSEGPILIPNPTDVKKKDAPATPLGAKELARRIKSAFPQVKNADVQFASAQSVRITLELTNEKELQTIAERVFALPELQNLRPELQFKISAP